MDTIIMRFGWIAAAKNLNDAQYREFINKVSQYGFSECTEDVSSSDEVVNAMLEMIKPSVRQSVSKYIDYR